MKNVESGENSFGHTFRIDSSLLSLFSYNNVVQASFFDLYDDVSLFFYLLKISEFKLIVSINDARAIWTY